MYILLGIPDVESVSETLSVSFSTTWGQETSHTDTKSDQLQGQAIIPPGFKTFFTFTGNNYVAQVPWSADVTTTYMDGSTSDSTTTGIYKGMRVYTIFHNINWLFDTLKLSGISNRYSNSLPLRDH